MPSFLPNRIRSVYRLWRTVLPRRIDPVEGWRMIWYGCLSRDGPLVVKAFESVGIGGLWGDVVVSVANFNGDEFFTLVYFNDSVFYLYLTL